MADTSTGVRKDNGYAPNPEQIAKKSATDLIVNRKAMSMAILGEKYSTSGSGSTASKNK